MCLSIQPQRDLLEASTAVREIVPVRLLLVPQRSRPRLRRSVHAEQTKGAAIDGDGEPPPAPDWVAAFDDAGMSTSPYSFCR